MQIRYPPGKSLAMTLKNMFAFLAFSKKLMEDGKTNCGRTTGHSPFKGESSSICIKPAHAVEKDTCDSTHSRRNLIESSSLSRHVLFRRHCDSNKMESWASYWAESSQTQICFESYPIASSATRSELQKQTNNTLHQTSVVRSSKLKYGYSLIIAGSFR